MKPDEIRSDLEEIGGIAKIAFSTFLVLEYLNQTIFDLEGDIITNNAFLRTSIFSNWRITVLELTKLFPATAKDGNNNFALRLFVHKLETQTTLLSEDELNVLRAELDAAYQEETNSGNKIVDNILVQRDTSIAHTDRGRIILPYGVSLANLLFLCRRAEIIIDIVHRKVHGREFTVNIEEPRNDLRNLVNEVADHRRKEIWTERMRKLAEG